MSVNILVRGSFECLTAETIPVPHCFTTRRGGVSTGYLSSLNIGTHRGDSPENVTENYRILAEHLGFDPGRLVLSSQTHSDTVTRVTSAHWGAGLTQPPLPACDALITDTPGTTLVVFTADCTPILLWDSRTGAIGAVHAGWRGTAANIAGKTVEAMVRFFGTNPADLRAAIGPNIGSCCFETDRDVPEALLAAYGSAAAPFIRQRGEKFFPDLKKINALALEQAGVTMPDVSTDCTACQPDRFWSHRITGGNRGSQGARITCLGDTL